MAEIFGKEKLAMSPKRSPARRRVSRRPPASGRKPVFKLTTRDVAACVDELLTYHREFHPFFQRREQREWSLFYLCGQFSNLERKTMAPMVLARLGPDPKAIRGLQQFIGQSPWEIDPLVEHAQRRVSQWLGEPEGIAIVDGSGFPKQGPHSVGAAPQYCGHLGKIANCQEGVFLLYASRHGYAFLDERLYLPRAWFTEAYRERRAACGVPESLVFRTEPELGLEMLQGVHQRSVAPFRWVACDETYGNNPAFLKGIETLGKWYLAEVPADTRVWLRTPAVEPPGPSLFGPERTRPRVKLTAPRPHAMRDLWPELPRRLWQRRVIKEGSKGPLVAEFAVVRVTPVCDQLPGPRGWAVFRRTLGPKPEVKFYLSNAPATCPRQELVRVSGLRWYVETALKENKGQLGMDHHQTRSWPGWHHHMLHAILAHLFLIRLQLLFQKKSRFDCGASATIDRRCHHQGRREFTRPPGRSALSSRAKLCGLSLPSQAYTSSKCQTRVHTP
jgi:SRSO17 transposase